MVTPRAQTAASATKRLRLPRTQRRTPTPKAERGADVGLPGFTHSPTTLSARWARGWGFTLIWVTRPLLKRMRRSAMGARAAVVGDDDDRDAVPAAGVLQELQDLLACLVVQARPWARRRAAAWGSWPGPAQWTHAAARRRRAGPGSCPCGRPGPRCAVPPRRPEGPGRSGRPAPRSPGRSGWAPGCRTGRQSRCRSGGTSISSSLRVAWLTSLPVHHDASPRGSGPCRPGC